MADERRYFGLDALRGTMMMLGIVLHGAMFYLASPPPAMPGFVERNNSAVFDVKIYRGQTTYQFTDRLLARNIFEYNSFNGTWAVNLLATYRLNAGTVFFVGYDDHYQQGNKFSGTVFPTGAYQRTNRAFFTKLQYLFRY